VAEVGVAEVGVADNGRVDADVPGAGETDTARPLRVVVVGAAATGATVSGAVATGGDPAADRPPRVVLVATRYTAAGFVALAGPSIFVSALTCPFTGEADVEPGTGVVP
jgi:hypothetical protein